MAYAPSTLAEFQPAPFDTVIDVRSPSEFAEDHVPGAINLPVLSDAERARVGTIYVQQSAFLARKIGAAIVARNAAGHIEGPLADRDGGWRPLIYCWRGGQRSGSFGAILAQIGWRVETLSGGYRAYRKLVKTMLYDQPFGARVVLLGGYTGTAKTDLLHLAAERGVQTLDLEGLANHRGSLFGAMSGGQPAQKGFESALAAAIGRLDPSRPVLVEAESSKVGDRIVPPSLWSAMTQAPRIEIAAPLSARAAYSARGYADIAEAPGRLDAILSDLVPLQGHQRVADWRALAAAGERRALAADLMRHHYDPRYAKSRGRPQVLSLIETHSLEPDALATVADRIAVAMSAL